jgi:membrane-associated phospholipid phosphatase
MGVIVARLTPQHRRLLVITLPAFIFMIGFSRVFLGVHWPTDVLAGFAAGGFLLLAGAITLDGLPSVAEAVASRRQEAR